MRVAPIPGHEGHYAQWLPGYLPWFMVGTAFAACSAAQTVAPGRTRAGRVLERLGSDLTGCWILAAAVFALACTPVAGPLLLLTPTAWEAGAKVVLYTVAGAFFVLPLVFGPERAGRVREWLSGPVPMWLGDISYGIFAIHLCVLNLVFHLLGIQVFTGRFLTVAGTTLVITIALASLSFRVLERPILRAKNIRFFARMEPPDRTVAPAAEIAP
jgi:peptidoglycan/LPS O-acetylase OafA/YrhL